MYKIRKNDNVMVMVGKDRGKTGTVEKMYTKGGKALIMGVNTYKRHVKGREGIEGGIIELPKPVAVSNLQIICKSCNKPTRVGFEITKDGKSRICKKCKKAIA